MLIYFINIIFFVIYSYLFLLSGFKYEKQYAAFVIVHLSLFMGLRSYEVGMDTPQYVSFYLNGNTTFNSNGALLYRLLSETISFFSGGNYHVFLFVLSFFTVYFFVEGILKFQLSQGRLFECLFIYISFYFFFDSFNIQRQMLAVAITFFAAALLREKKFFLSFVFIVLATEIHSTALIMFLIFPLIAMKKSGFRLILISGALVVVKAYLLELLGVFSSLFGHYNMYASIVADNLLSSNGGTLWMGLFILSFLLIGFIFVDMVADRVEGFVITMTLIGAILSIIGMRSQLIIRIAEYFSVYMVVAIPWIIDEVSNRFEEKKIVSWGLKAIVFLTGTIVLVYKLSHNMGGIVPYNI